MTLDLFAAAGLPALHPEPEVAEIQSRPGEVLGDVTADEIEAVVGRLVIWCGPHGWRSPGALVNRDTVSVVQHQGRLLGSLKFDLGAAKLIRGKGESDG